MRNVFSYRRRNYFCDQIYDAASDRNAKFVGGNKSRLSFSGQNMVPLQIVRFSDNMELGFKLSFRMCLAGAGADANGIERLSITECEIRDSIFVIICRVQKLVHEKIWVVYKLKY